MTLNEIECTNLKNSNLFKYVSKIGDTNFVKEYCKVCIVSHVYHIFWIRDCKKFNRTRLHSKCGMTTKFDRILQKIYISWILYEI